MENAYPISPKYKNFNTYPSCEDYPYSIKNLYTGEVAFCITSDQLLKIATLWQSEEPNSRIYILGRGKYVIGERWEK